MMKDELIKHLTDCSTEDTLCFKFKCSSCGKWYYSEPTPFSRDKSTESDESKRVIYDALYKREWTKTRNAALNEAVDHFSICPICHGLICDRCFLICDDIEMCRACAERLHQSGKPVTAETVGG